MVRPQPSDGRCDSGAFELESTDPDQGELFVDAQEGNDGNSCFSQQLPCKTIGAAVRKAQAGDTVVIAAGNYTAETLPITIGKNLTPDTWEALLDVVDRRYALESEVGPYQIWRLTDPG